MTGSRFHFWVFDPVPEPNMSAHIGVLPASDFHACLSRLMKVAAAVRSVVGQA